MHRKDAIAWVVGVCASSLLLSQAKTLAILVASAMTVERISLANIGRAVAGGIAKHQIKRAWRFCANERVETADAMRGVLKKLLHRRRRRPLVVSLDWTDIRCFQTLMACAVLDGGRSVPICWASCLKHVYDGHRSRNSFEEALLLTLRSMIPANQKVILLADRGFGRTELARFCQHNGFDHLIRVQPNVHVRCASFSGKLIDYPLRRGTAKLLKEVTYRSHHSVTLKVVVRWVRNLPAHRDEPWFLISSVDAGPAQLCRLYGKRMGIEQLFRDAKNKRNGWSLRDTQITRPDRLDRLLLILALVYLLLCGMGLLALTSHHPGHWTAASGNDCSIFTIGRLMLAQIQCSPAQATAAILAATQAALPKWG